MLLQQLFSCLNNHFWIPYQISKAKGESLPKVSIQIVGYRYEVSLFKSCFNSLKRQKYANLSQIIVGIDGN